MGERRAHKREMGEVFKKVSNRSQCISDRRAFEGGGLSFKEDTEGPRLSLLTDLIQEHHGKLGERICLLKPTL